MARRKPLPNPSRDAVSRTLYPPLLTFRCPEPLFRQLREISKAEYETLSNTVRRLLLAALKERTGRAA